MKQSSLGSLRGRLVLVVLIAIIPSLALIYYNARSRREDAVAQAHDDVARLTRLTAADCARMVEGARQFLLVVAALPDVRNGMRRTVVRRWKN